MFTQLNPPLPVFILDRGKGLAMAVIDYGPEHNLIWVTALDDSGEIWCAPNPKVRMQSNWTMGRAKPDGREAVAAGRGKPQGGVSASLSALICVREGPRGRPAPYRPLAPEHDPLVALDPEPLRLGQRSRLADAPGLDMGEPRVRVALGRGSPSGVTSTGYWLVGLVISVPPWCGG